MHKLLLMITKDMPMKIIPINGKPYLERYYVGTDSKKRQHWLHRILVSDSERWLHTHPFKARSTILTNRYTEERAINGDINQGSRMSMFTAGSVNDINETTLHRIVSAEPNTWSHLIVDPGRKATWEFIGDDGRKETRRASDENWHKLHGNRESEYRKFNSPYPIIFNVSDEDFETFANEMQFKLEKVFGAATFPVGVKMFNLTPGEKITFTNTDSPLSSVRKTNWKGLASPGDTVIETLHKRRDGNYEGNSGRIYNVPADKIRKIKSQADEDLVLLGQSFLLVKPNSNDLLFTRILTTHIRDNKADADMDLRLFGESLMRVPAAIDACKFDFSAVANFGGYNKETLKYTERMLKLKTQHPNNFEALLEISSQTPKAVFHIVELFEASVRIAEEMFNNEQISSGQRWSTVLREFAAHLRVSWAISTESLAKLKSVFVKVTPQVICKSTLGVLTTKPKVQINEVDLTEHMEFKMMKFYEIPIGKHFKTSSGKLYVKCGRCHYEPAEGRMRTYSAHGEKMNYRYLAEV